MVKGIVVDYQGKQITATIYEQQIWFSMAELKKIIDMESVCSYFDESARMNVDGKQMEMVNEFGLYRLLCLMTSDKAKDFRKWLIGDAIIRLRKYGCYKLSIAEQKKKIINEIVQLNGEHLEVEKLKYLSLDKLKLEKSRLEKTFERQKREKETVEKRGKVKKDFPFSHKELEENYDVNLAIKNLSWSKENLDEYMVCINNSEWWFSKKFIEYLENGDYKW